MVRLICIHQVILKLLIIDEELIGEGLVGIDHVRWLGHGLRVGRANYHTIQTIH